MDLFPVSVALFPDFVLAVIYDLNCLLIDIEENAFLFPMWQAASAQTVQAVQFLKRFILMITSGSHVYISKTLKVSSGLISDNCSESVTAVTYAISYYNWPRYNGTRLCWGLEELLMSTSEEGRKQTSVEYNSMVPSNAYMHQ